MEVRLYLQEKKKKHRNKTSITMANFPFVNGRCHFTDSKTKSKSNFGLIFDLSDL